MDDVKLEALKKIKASMRKLASESRKKGKYGKGKGKGKCEMHEDKD